MRRGNACLTIYILKTGLAIANQCMPHFTTVSLALATMAASSSSVMSMARLNWVVSVVLKVAGRNIGVPFSVSRDLPR